MNVRNLTGKREPPPLCVYVDVDGTLIRNQGSRNEPNPALVARIRQWQAEGTLLYCWSSQGADYARHIAKNLELETCFSAFLCKPHVVVDDEDICGWRYFLHLYPTQGASHTTADLEQLLDAIER